MDNTPKGNRLHIGIFGDTNVGKSALFNKITETAISIVSDIAGTTTDPVRKKMELLPAGPVVFIDTAGLKDISTLGNERIIKTFRILEEVDFALYLIDSNNINYSSFESLKDEFEAKKIPYLVVFTKNDDGRKIKTDLEEYISVSINDENSIENLRKTLAEKLVKQTEKEIDLMEGILEKGSTVVLVCPIDSEAPKGRLILPQVQIIRSCLDNGISCFVTTDDMLEDTLSKLEKVDLVITDSQAFKVVDEIVPKHIPLTSFSILMSRQKGDIDTFINSAKILDTLENGDHVLIAEVCTHNKTHEDIGRVKIPFLIRNKTKKDLNFEFVTGQDYPSDLSKYKLAIHCGGCMMTKTQMYRRINKYNNISNYGIVIAYCTGILSRAIEIFNKGESDV